MRGFLLKLSDIKDFKKVRWRHVLQSVLVLSCFCTLDTVVIDNTIWLISAGAAVTAIGLAMLIVAKIALGYWTNALNIITAGLCVGCYFSEICFPFAIFFAALTAVIRLIYARRELNDYCALVFIVGSVFFGIVIRFALILLPVWTLGILMFATVLNPVIKKEQIKPQAEAIQSPAKKHNPVIILAGIMLVVFLLCIEVFGGTLTDKVSHTFIMQMVNLAYIAGYTLFIAAILCFRIKSVSVATMILAVLGLFFFLVPTTTTFGIYYLLLIGGGIKVLMLTFPITAFKGKRKIYGAFGGVVIYRLGFLFSGVAKTLAGEQHWHITSPLTYTLAAVNIALAIGLIFLLIYWDRREIKAEYESRPPIIKEVIREIPVIVEVPIEVPIIKKSLPSDLAEQELRIAKLILKGKTQKEIAAEMCISGGAVSTYAMRIYIKAGVDDQKDFITYFTFEN